MPNDHDVLPVLCLAGATGTGKTGLALRLAEMLDGEVINTDSRQVYADFPIVCAQPDAREKACAPHHLYGFLETTARISAGEWRKMAVGKIREVLARGHTPLLVGGTGMYFHALLHGIAPIPAVDPGIRRLYEERIDACGPEVLHAELQQKDPDYAARIHAHDRQRIVRALEVLEQTGRTFTWWHTQTEICQPRCTGPLFVLETTLADLEPRLARRIDAMLERGALEEVLLAYQRCPDLKAWGWSGIGCAELLAYAEGRIDLPTCRMLWQQATRAYAKRQNTWFRGRREARMYPVADPDPLLLDARIAWMELRESCRFS